MGKPARSETPLEIAVRTNIKTRLEGARLTQRALGEALHHKDSWVSDALRGQKPIAVADIDRAAEFLTAKGVATTGFELCAGVQLASTSAEIHAAKTSKTRILQEHAQFRAALTEIAATAGRHIGPSIERDQPKPPRATKTETDRRRRSGRDRKKDVG
jgi:hypothetical protein